MILEIVALVTNAIISIVLPLIILGIMIKKNREQWKGLIAIFVCGGLIYTAMQWGVKEHGLTWLFNNTKLMDFMENHYIPYLLLIAFAGAVLTVLGQVLVIVAFGKKVTVGKVIAFSVGYSMVEATWLVGIRSVNTIVEVFKETDLTLNTSVGELFLSGYERILLLIIEMAIFMILTYFVQHNMSIRGVLIAIICYTLVSFLPGFFIAFSLPEYLEVFSRSTTLMMVHIVLTASTFASLVIMKVCKNL